MQLIITRHGETKENIAGILMGQQPGTLTEKGVKQAKALATALKKFKLNYIYSSDLSRSRETTQEILKYHINTPIEYTQALRETNMGELEGRRITELLGKGSKLIESKTGESLKNLYDRAQLFIAKLHEKHKDETILLVAHNGINKALFAVITGVSAEKLNSVHGQDNAAITIFEIDENKNYKLTISNDTNHLKLY